MRTLAMVLGVLVTAATSIPAKDLGQVPNDFPRFMAVGQEGPLDALRRMYWLYYPQQGGGGTLWDEWLVCPNLWPATGEEEARNAVLRTWREGLDSRRMDEDGYVSTHQHASIAHPAGWPFPAWIQGKGTMGWHFSFKDTVGPPWRGDVLSTTTGWLLQGARDAGVGEWGWRVVLEQPQATLTFPAHPVDSFQSPFLQIRWKAEGLAGAHPFIEWTNESHPEFTPD